MKYTYYLLSFFLILFFSCENAKDYRTNAEKYFKEKKYDKALISINKAIQLEPDSISNYSLRFLLYDLTRKYKEEILDLNKIIELNKKGENNKSLDLNTHHQRAVVQIQIGLYNEALLDINYFIDNRDTVGSLTEAYINKASILYKLNDLKNAEKFYNLVLKENNGKNKYIESQALVGLANLSKSQTGALKLLNKAIIIYDSCIIAYGARGALYLNLGKIDLAYNDFLKAISMHKPTETNIASIYFNMGQLFVIYKNNNDSAAKYFEKAIELSPESPDNDIIYMSLAIIKHQAGKLDNALKDFEKADSINPKNDLLLYNYALLLSDLKRNKEALEKINRAIKIDSNKADYFDTKGTILIDLSLFKEAEASYKKAISIDPYLGSVNYNLGYLFGEQNDYVQSTIYYEKAIALNFDLENTLVNCALIKIKLKKIYSACLDLERAYNLGRTDIKPLIEENCK